MRDLTRRTPFVAIQANNAIIRREKFIFVEITMVVNPFIHILTCEKNADQTAPCILVGL